MRRYLTILTVIMLSLILVAGCSKDKKDSNKPASASGRTGTNGVATLELGSYTVTATVQNQSNAALANINVNGYLSHQDVLLTVYDTTGAYYPSITLAPLSQGSGKRAVPDRVNSPDEIAGTAIAATITLYPVQLSAFGLDEAAGFDGIVSDDWTTEQWHTGTLENAYNLIDSVPAYSRGVFIHLSQGVGQSSGAAHRTTVFLPSQISDFPTFSTLIGLNFNLFAGDTLHYCQMTYSGAQLPIIHVDNVIMHRDFWAQFTLVWGETPYDLDSHLWTPSYGAGNTRYHVWYMDHGSQVDEPHADLDVDDTQSYGPEHMTIYQAKPGSYTYAVHDYRGYDGLISGSHAVVSLLKPDGTVQTFTVPTDSTNVQENYWWIVCRIDGTTGAVSVVDSVTATPPFPLAEKTMPAK